MNGSERPIWARAMTDPDLFRWEQERLGSQWTLLGVTGDVAEDGDWFRATLGGRSVFVQRFGSELRGFENVCAHRFFPLRTEDRGNGPIRCGFHHWLYDEEGRAVGIPKCKEIFGVTPKEMNARLAPVEVATCGQMIFGRFAEPGAQPSLEQHMGDGFAILEAATRGATLPEPIVLLGHANWKLGLHISLDDYHLVAIHPDSLGRDGYLSTGVLRNYRLADLHSALFVDPRGDTPPVMAAACRDGSYQPEGYRIFHFFPTLFTSQFRGGGRYHVLIQHYVPVAVDRTLIRAWMFPAPFAEPNPGLLRRITRPAVDSVLRRVVPNRYRKILGEDNLACERLQTVAGQAGGPPLLSQYEERIGWFQQAYEECVGPEPTPSDSA